MCVLSFEHGSSHLFYVDESGNIYITIRFGLMTLLNMLIYKLAELRYTNAKYMIVISLTICHFARRRPFEAQK